MAKLLDCTLRDGGYYNAWDFDIDLINDYLQAMSAISVDHVELGFRSLKTAGFKGACAYTTDGFIRTIKVPSGLSLGVMVNAVEIVSHPEGVEGALKKLFLPASESPISLVRVACHVHEFEAALPAAEWLKDQGYIVGFNVMQISERSEDEITSLARAAGNFPLDVLYFADSMGGLTPNDTASIISALRKGWRGAIGFHAHDNMGLALSNAMRAQEEGATWIDGTVMGMGRGPGNAKTEYLALEMEGRAARSDKITPLLRMAREYFQPLHDQYEWGSNPYYYLSGKYGIHPTYIQSMLSDSRYNEEDIIATINHLRHGAGQKFNTDELESARITYQTGGDGSWAPRTVMDGRDVLVLGTGPNVKKHSHAIEAYIAKNNPYVIGINTQQALGGRFIDLRVSCHPVRLMADIDQLVDLPEPVVIPKASLSDEMIESFGSKDVRDFGLIVEPGKFAFYETGCVLPAPLVVAYALAISASGGARRVYVAGFDGYPADDPRNKEMDSLLNLYQGSDGSPELCALTPSRYDIPERSVYSFL